jgi:hypothetical protein
MAQREQDRTRVRRQHYVRVASLKRRVAAASLLGFAAVFGLVAQHAVKGSSSARPGQSLSAHARPTTATTTFFDEQADGFAFGDAGASGFPSAAPPVAQTSVS